ncbi:monocarboxylate transporter 3 [Rhipicephalus microplus]|uniref:monocarboxylate transporter 3 n=1 Tax=Rhipicephalus microplus TaxID=6941 RepID=UPI003F6D3DCF
MAVSMVCAKKDTRFGVDSRRSWVTAVFLSLTLAAVLIGQHSVGVLFYGIVHTYGVSRKDASLPLLLCQSLSFLAGPVMGYLCSRFSCRMVLLVSTFAAGATVSSCFFVDNILYINILFGIVYGVAACGVHVGANVLVSQHFEKRRATACSIIYTSLGINSLYLPPLAEFLRVTYGIRGTFLLLGGLILHSLPPALAVRSPEWAKPRRQSSGSAVTQPEMNAEVAPNNLLLPENGTQGCHNPDDHEEEFTESRHVQTSISCINDLPSLNSTNTSGDKTYMRKATLNTIKREFISTPFVVNAVSFTIITLGLSAFLLLSVDIAKDKGIAPSSGVFLLNAFAVTDIVMRPLSGLVIDSGVLSLESVMLVGYLLQSLVLELFVLLDSFPVMLALSALFGISNGLRITLLMPSLTKHFGVDRMPLMLGGVGFWIGVTLIAGPFLVGYWRDRLGSYDGLLHFMAALNAALAIIWAAKLCLQRRQKPLLQHK